MTNVRIIKAAALTDSHLDAWRQLQRTQISFQHPFLCPELVQMVAQVRDDVEVAVLEQEGRPHGFFAYQRLGDQVAEPVAREISDMQALVVEPEVEIDMPAILRAARLKAWHFDHLQASQSFLESHPCSLDPAYYIDLHDGFEAYSEQRARAGCSLLNQTQRKSRKLAREVGPLRFEFDTRSNQVMQQLKVWKQEHLRSRGYSDVFAKDWIVQLLDLVHSAKTKYFSGLLSALYAGDRLVAVQLGMRGHGVLNAWIPAYDPDYAKYSPGAILQVEQARQAADAGVQRIDLGRGENQTKLGFASGTTPLAIGSIDLRPVRRLLTRSWYYARDVAHATPLRGKPLKVYRRVRNYLARS